MATSIPKRHPHRGSEDHAEETAATTPTPDSREALAVHIAAIMAHPLTPARVFNEVGDFINDEWSEVMPQLERDPAFILRILDRGTCGYLLCPGGGCKGECTRMSNKELKRKRGAK